MYFNFNKLDLFLIEKKTCKHIKMNNQNNKKHRFIMEKLFTSTFSLLGSRFSLIAFFSLLLATNFLLLNSCNTTEPLPIAIKPADTLSLKIQSTSFTSIVLNLRTTANNTNANVILKRFTESRDTILFTLPLIKLDTLIVDNNKGKGLKLNTEYRYVAIIKRTSDNKIISTSDTILAKTKYAVNQEFTWKEYSIGEWQSGFSDVWGVDENNVYLTGYIKTDSLLYGLAKWNGVELELLSEIGGIGIYGFSNSDIWLVGGAVQHYDGSNWERIDGYSLNNQDYPLDTVLFNNTPYFALWGTSNSNLYMVGAMGKVVHWDGKKGKVVYGESNVNLSEIQGYNQNFIIACGAKGIPPSIAIKYDGKKWEVIDGLDYNRLYYGIYVVSPEEYYICGAKIYRYYNKEWQEVVGDSLGMKIDIKGDKKTGEIVAVGRVNTILHWNGVKWKNIGKNISNEINNLYSVYITNGKIFAVGTNGVTAKLFIGTRK